MTQIVLTWIVCLLLAIMTLGVLILIAVVIQGLKDNEDWAIAILFTLVGVFIVFMLTVMWHFILFY